MPKGDKKGVFSLNPCRAVVWRVLRSKGGLARRRRNIQDAGLLQQLESGAGQELVSARPRRSAGISASWSNARCSARWRLCDPLAGLGPRGRPA